MGKAKRIWPHLPLESPLIIQWAFLLLTPRHTASTIRGQCPSKALERHFVLAKLKV